MNLIGKRLRITTSPLCETDQVQLKRVAQPSDLSGDHEALDLGTISQVHSTDPYIQVIDIDTHNPESNQ